MLSLPKNGRSTKMHLEYDPKPVPVSIGNRNTGHNLIRKQKYSLGALAGTVRLDPKNAELPHGNYGPNANERKLARTKHKGNGRKRRRRAAGNAPRIGGRSSPQPQQLECPVSKGRAGRDGGQTRRGGSGAPAGSRRRQLGFRARLPSPPPLAIASLKYSNGGGVVWCGGVGRGGGEGKGKAKR